MPLRLPDAPARYDPENEAQLRRAIEVFSHKPLAMVSEDASTLRITGGVQPLAIYGPEGVYATITRGQLYLYPQDDDLEGGEISLQGGPNAAGADFDTWHMDNYTGLVRFYSGASVFIQFGITSRYQFIGPGQTSTVEINGTASVLRWYEADQAVDEKTWEMLADAKVFTFRTINDAFNTPVNIFTLTRGAGTAIGYVRLGTGIDFLTNNAYDIGTGGNYPRSIGFATSLTASGTQVVSTRRTGWTAATGTAQRGTFATDTVTLINLARAVKALIDDLHNTAGHGLIGT